MRLHQVTIEAIEKEIYNSKKWKIKNEDKLKYSPESLNLREQIIYWETKISQLEEDLKSIQTNN